MAEIPSWMWMISGVIITGFSVFMGFNDSISYNMFFKIMIFVGLIMLGFGWLKMKLRQRTPEQTIDDMRAIHSKRDSGEVEINIDDYRNNPQLRQQAMQQQAKYPPTQQQLSTQGRSHNPNHPQHMNHNVQHNASHSHMNNPSANHVTQPHNLTHSRMQARFCHQCGSPLLPQHKFCPICGSRV
ncbi:MAG: zinc ribbon domain-containing protein [Candidatus Woesearchaeota archaeon]|nr:zinc ribbon domain-containing protein [Candidatus Woesearchaeota archaeon]